MPALLFLYSLFFVKKVNQKQFSQENIWNHAWNDDGRAKGSFCLKCYKYVW